MKQEDFAAFFSEMREELAYVADIETYEIIYMTKAAMRLMGLHSEEEYRNRKCYQIMQGLNEPCPFCTNRYLLNGQSPYIWEQYNPIAKKWLRLENYLFDLDGRRCRGEWAVDISAEHHKISALESRLELGEVILRSTRILATVPDIHSALNLFLQNIGTYYQAERAVIFEINYENQNISNTYEWCAEGVVSRKSQYQDAPLELVKDWIDMFRTGVEQIFVSPEQGAAIKEDLSSRGVSGLLVAPLQKGDVLAGFLGVDNAVNNSGDSTLLRLSADLIMEEFQKRQLIQALGSHELIDRLTGLQNRRKYMQTLEAYQQNPPKSLAVYFIDLNGLKEINEQRGHDAGDRFIYQCGEVLRGLDMNTFRVDGDEFVILQPDVTQGDAMRQEILLRSALEALLPNTVSLGTAWSAGNVDVMALLTESDERMYAEKQIYYRESASKGHSYRTGMAMEVLQEIHDSNFVVYFQPQVDLKTGAIYGAEALVRKVDSDGKIISPAKFVPIYEAEGVISHLDFHVLMQVCTLMKTWREKLNQFPKISVNFSRLTLMETDVVRHICEICNAHGISPGQFTVEVTESAGKLSQEQLHSLVLGLQEAGFSVSLDDFGSQYSNLSILSSIDFQMIKLDKSLIDKIGIEEKSTKLVQSLIHLCKDIMDTPTLAEGVETGEQAAMLRSFSCDYIQGYYFSRPIPAEEFTAMLEEDKNFFSA